jgi:hypothetical protein
VQEARERGLQSVTGRLRTAGRSAAEAAQELGGQRMARG